jgi:predicted dehydrogenase
MKQVLRKGFKDIVVDEVPDPVVTPHHVLVRPHYSLISSGTETASIHPDVLKEVAHNPSQLQKVLEVAKVEGPMKTIAELRAKFSAYAVLGYSGAGVVADKHPTVKDLEIGERVVYGGEGTGHGETIVTGRNLVARVPQNVPLQHATFATLGAIAMNSVRVANIGLGDTVAVMGLGLVGQLVAQLARLQGGVVTGIDLKPDRVTLAEQLGADHGVSDANAMKEAVLNLTGGRGADCVIVAAAAKSPIPCQQALQMVRDRGRIVIVGAVEVSFPWLEAYLKEVQILMSRAYGPGSYDPNYEAKGQDYPASYVRWTENRNMEEFLRVLSTGKLNVQPLITHEYELEQAPEAYATIMNPAANSLAVVLKYPEADLPAPTAESRPAMSRKVFTVAGQANAKERIDFALVGAGGIARWAHMPVMEKITGVKMRAMYSSNGARAKTYAMRYGAEYCCTDYNEVLGDPNVDLVVIVSRNQYHARQSVQALRAGKHVFVEKPMALTVEECREVLRAVDESGKSLTVGFNRRFAPYYLQQKRALARRSGPAVINCRINSPGISGGYWMADPAIGGAILGEACHFIDLMYWLLDSEPVSVSAYSLPTDTEEPVGLNNIAASFRFQDGSIGNLTYCTVGSKTSGGERVEVFAQGVGVVSENFKKLAINGATSRKEGRFFADKGYDPQMRSFLRSLTSGKPHPVDVVDGIRSTLGCLRMLDAARTGEACDITLADIVQASDTARA